MAVTGAWRLASRPLPCRCENALADVVVARGWLGCGVRIDRRTNAVCWLMRTVMLSFFFLFSFLLLSLGARAEKRNTGLECVGTHACYVGGALHDFCRRVVWGF